MKKIFLLFVSILISGCSLSQYYIVKNRTSQVKIITKDGVEVTLHHFVPKEKKYPFPVIISHGIAVNNRCWDLEKGNSFPQYLNDKGFDVWSVDLRGVGDNKTPDKGDYGFDAYVDIDVPVIIDKVTNLTKSKKILWVGHSMGGMVIYSYLGKHKDNRIKGIIAVGSPMNLLKEQLPFVLQNLMKYQDMILSKFNFIPLGKLVNPVSPFSKTLYLDAEFVAYNLDNFSYYTSKKFLTVGVDNIASGVLGEFVRWINTNKMTSNNGQTDYQANLQKITTPALLLAGSMDNLGSVESVTFAYDRLSSKDKELKIFSIANGSLADYGHVDLIISKNAKKEVFPVMYQWLVNHSK